MMCLLDSARDYLERGLSVLPARSVDPRNPTREKVPLIEWKPYQKRLPKISELKAWFTDGCKADGIAIVGGAVSGNLVVRDFDVPGAYEEWAKQYEDIAEILPTVKAFRGYHVYSRVRRAELLKSYKCPDGEYRAEGLYVLAPPSMHPEGIPYEWFIPLPDGPIPVIDTVEAGLAHPKRYTEGAEDTEDSSHLEGPLCPSAPFCVTSAMAACIPTGPGQRNNCLFKLARMLKSTPEYACASAAELKPVFGDWHRRATPFIRTKPYETSWGEFLHAWKNVRFPYGESAVGKALARARGSEVPPEAIHFEQAELILLVQLCRELQRAQGDQTFFLDCRLAGASVGTTHQTAWRWLRMLVDEGTLELVRRGSRRKKLANEYRYRGQM
jgi:hypothetical protein